MKKRAIFFGAAVLAASIMMFSACSDAGNDNERFTVTFNANGGIFTASNNEVWHTQVQAGRSVNPPLVPPVNGDFMFVGWFLNPEFGLVPWDFTNPIYSNMTLYARWAGYHRVTFDTQGGTPVTWEVQVQHNTPVDQPEDPAKSGYEFDGWLTQAGAQWDFTTPVNQNKTLYASWAAVFTVTFDAVGGSPVPPQQVVSGSIITAPLSFKRYGNFIPTTPGLFIDSYQLTGWTFNGAPWNFNTGTVAGNMTLTAQWGTGPDTNPIDLSNYEWRFPWNNIVNKAFEYAVDNPAAYILALDQDVTVQSIMANFVSDVLDGEGVSLKIIGLGGERTIRPPTYVAGASRGTLFWVQNGAELIIGNNITLAKTGFTDGNMVLVDSGASFVMLPGSKVTGNNSRGISPTIMATGSAVVVGNGGTFIMKGGEIAGNNINRFTNSAAGLNVLPGGTVNMQGGSIHGNVCFDVNATPRGSLFDVFIHAGDTNNSSSFTMSASAHIEYMNIESTITARNMIKVGENWTGGIYDLVFSAVFQNDPQFADTQARVFELVGWWVCQPVFTAAPGRQLTTADVGRITEDLSFLATMTGAPLAWYGIQNLLIIDSGPDIGRIGFAGWTCPGCDHHNGGRNETGGVAAFNNPNDAVFLPLGQVKRK